MRNMGMGMGMDPREASDDADCNFINAVDGRNNSSTWVRDDEGRRRKEKEEPSASNTYRKCWSCPSK